MLSYRVFRKGALECSSVAEMRCFVYGYNRTVGFGFLLFHPSSVLLNDRVTVSRTIDVFPCLGIDVREFIWGNANNGSVLQVQVMEVLVEIT
jgi:hypothetical protein